MPVQRSLMRDALADCRQDLNCANEQIGAQREMLRESTANLKKADSLLHRAHAEISMLEARIERGRGADKTALCELALIITEAMARDGIKVKEKHLRALREVAL